MVVLPLIVFAIGLLIGSFLNVVILRINTGRSIVNGRSKCARCGRVLAWYELIPVASFLGLRGKCRTCKEGISFQYPFVELVTAIVFVICYIKFLLAGMFTPAAWIAFVFALCIASLLIVITVYDVRHRVIPDVVVYPFILLALGSVVYRVMEYPALSLFGALLGGVLVALPFFLFWYFSKGRVMGFGDVKLALGIGWLLGIAQGYSAVVLAFWIGAIVGLFLLALTRRYGMKSQIPFGPFLVLGVFIVALWGVTISTLFPLWP